MEVNVFKAPETETLWNGRVLPLQNQLGHLVLHEAKVALILGIIFGVLVIQVGVARIRVREGRGGGSGGGGPVSVVSSGSLFAAFILGGSDGWDGGNTWNGLKICFDITGYIILIMVGQ